MSPKEACEYARECGPSNETREIACESPVWAYIYAWIIDRNPRNETRKLQVKFEICIFLCIKCRPRS